MHKIFAFIGRQSRLIALIMSFMLPIILLPLAFSPQKELKCAYVILVVISFWLLEPVGIAVTALLPLVLLPTMGVMNSTDVALNYMNEAFMMFIGALIVSIAVENCNLHERVALKVLLLIGTEIKWLMLGFMLTTMFLSMWMSNIGTTAMMVTIAESIMGEMTLTNVDTAEIPLTELADESLTNMRGNSVEEGLEKMRKGKRKKSLRSSGLRTALLLSISYSANIGGTATLTGSGPNLVLKGYLEDTFPESDEITFASWLMYCVPGTLSCVLIAWFYLYMVYIRCSNSYFECGNRGGIRDIVMKKYKKLGSIRFNEAATIVLALLLISLWVFRDPKVINGWSALIASDKKIGDSVPSIGVAFLLFLLPSDPWHFTTSPPILDWKTAQKKLPWGVIILCGGGFALANAAKRSGLSLLVGDKMTALSIFPPEVIVVILCFMTAILTEVMSNTSTATILLPVLSQMAVSIGVNPLFLLVPVTITCSYAFMLPVATPTNAIAFESGQMRIVDMAKPGFAMNMVCCCVQLFMINTLGVKMFNLNEFPSWANDTAFNSPVSTSDMLHGINSSHIYANESNIVLT